MAMFSSRKSVLIISILVVFAAIAVKLFQVQIINKEYLVTAENNALKYETRYPARGRILDRYGKTMVENKIIYDVMVTPVEVTAFDTLALCKIFDLDPDYVKQRFEYFRQYRTRIGYGSMPFVKQVSSEQYNVFIEQSFRFPGFSTIVRSSRTYPQNAGGNLLGYVSEVDQKYLDSHPDYKMGDYAGRSGMEQAYEDRLSGQKGYTIYLRDAHNRIKEPYDNGNHDIEPVAGNDITTTIDIELQAFGEALMKNKVGSLVAIEPKTGEVLTLISSPSLDASQLSEINKHYSEVINNPYRPMYNRAVQSAQPPGSVFKLVNGLIGLQEGVLKPETRYPCHSGYIIGKFRLGCHAHPSPIDLRQSVMMSCNAYYCYVIRSILDNPKYGGNIEASFNKWREYVNSFGFGLKLGSDIPAELGGNVPETKVYDKIHGKGRWNSLSVISLSIGQGELGCTPLHLANLAATIANRGYYYIPHIIRDDPDYPLDEKYRERHYTMVDTTFFPIIIDGMYMAVHAEAGGTARIAKVPGLEICGKTGTAQNPHGDDHSVFICFAPKDDPKIAVAAYVENGGFGATWAAPIASLLVEKYLNGKISEPRRDLEKRCKDGNLLHKVPIRKRKR